MELQGFDRIEARPEVLGGKPCIKGTRLSVQFVLELLGSGGDRASILRSYPHLTVEDIDQAVRFAAWMLQNDIVIDAEVGR